MEAQELRIGNWVKTRNGYFYITEIVNKITQRDHWHRYVSVTNKSIGNNQQWTFKEIKPIPLTPEILDKIEGVEYNKHTSEWWVRNVYIGFNLNQAYLGNKVMGDKQFICEVNYLHELQNATYYPLNRTELNINLKQ